MHLIGIEISWESAVEIIDQPLPSNLLKNDSPLTLTIYKCQRKQQWVSKVLQQNLGGGTTIWTSMLFINVNNVIKYSLPITAQGP